MPGFGTWSNSIIFMVKTFAVQNYYMKKGQSFAIEQQVLLILLPIVKINFCGSEIGPTPILLLLSQFYQLLAAIQSSINIGVNIEIQYRIQLFQFGSEWIFFLELCLFFLALSSKKNQKSMSSIQTLTENLLNT